MADDKYTFEAARIRLEEIAAEVRKKDTSLEKSLDLLEEGVRLANICTELVDHTDVSVTAAPVSEGMSDEGEGAQAVDAESADGPADAVGEAREDADVPDRGEDGSDEADDDTDESADAASDE